MSSEIVLQEGQMLLEVWHVEFKGKNRIHRPVDEWIECQIVRAYNSTIYGGAHGYGKNVHEARLEAVLGYARAICDDVNAFQHDADEIFKAEMLRWFEGTIKEMQDELDEEAEEKDRPKVSKKGQRRIKLLEELQAMWQEDHDYWPDEETEATSAGRQAARAAKIRADTAKRRAAAAARADAGEPAGSADHVLAGRDGDDEPRN